MLFQKQIMMRRVLYSLVPILLYAVYLYGLRPLAYCAVVFVAGISTEYFFQKIRKTRGKVSEAVLVTCALYVLSLPPRLPLWIAGVGIVFGVAIGKMAFGGFGRNVFNPAITGRLFIYMAFPTAMTTQGWVMPGDFGRLSTDAIASVTILGRSDPVQAFVGEGSPTLKALFLGLRQGSLGEGAILFIVLAGIYLVVTKTASWRIIVSTILSFTGLAFLFHRGGIGALSPLHSLMIGSFLYVAVFMATDPVTAPKKAPSQWIYGLLIGSTAYLIRSFSLFPEGTSFAVLLGNTFAMFLDDLFTSRPRKIKEG